MAEFNTDELRHLAAKALLPEKLVIDTASETVRRFREVWQAEKNNLPLTEKVTNMIDAHAPTIPLYEELRRNNPWANVSNFEFKYNKLA